MSASNFFNQDLLTKRGALAQVWMASHLSTKLSKQALTSTSIPKSVQSILGNQLASMAIRLSGQLLLGIARIYSRKTKYLLDDAQETLGKVKKAFQNEGRAAVDLPADQQVTTGGDEGARAGRDINLRREGGDLEDLLAVDFGGEEEWSLDKFLAANTGKEKGKGKGKALTANLADITLDESHNHAEFFDYDDIDGLGNADFDLGLDADFALFEEDDELNALAGPSESRSRPNKRSRGNGEEDEDRADGDLSVELGRDAAPHLSSDRGSIAPLDFDKNRDLDGDFGMLAPENGPDDMGGFDGGGFDAGFDLGLDFGADQEFGGGGDDGERLPSFDPLDESRAGSAPLQVEDTEAGDPLQLTPRAAAAVNERQAAEGKQPAKKRQKALAMDKVIELDWQSARLAGKARFKDPEFLPRSRLHLALLEPNAHLSLLPQAIPKTSKNAPSLEFYAPPGLLARELQDLFRMPTRRERIKLEGRQRSEKADQPVELGRRATSVFSNLSNVRDDNHYDFEFGGGGEGDDAEQLDFEFGLAKEGEDLGGFDGGDNFDFDLGLDNDQADVQADSQKTPTKRSKKAKTSHAGDGEREVTPARSVGSGRGIFEDDEKIYQSEGPLAIFDELGSGRTLASSTSVATLTPSRSQAASQSLATEAEEAAAAQQSQGDTLTQKSGSISLRSKNTRKAVTVIQEQLELDDEATESNERKVEFNKVAEKASRRAASSFFFELLVLSSADVVKIKQEEAFGDIEVRGTEKLRELAV
ncbi:hypothetical protein JCM16303_004518 [Sporobolomyces ruberrimus]